MTVLPAPSPSQAPSPIRIYGWYDSPDQPCEKPSFDPGMDSACPHCGRLLYIQDVRTHSFVDPGAMRAYFYRTHRSCAERADQVETDGVFRAVLDRIKHNGD